MNYTIFDAMFDYFMKRPVLFWCLVMLLVLLCSGNKDNDEMNAVAAVAAVAGM